MPWSTRVIDAPQFCYIPLFHILMVHLHVFNLRILAETQVVHPQVKEHRCAVIKLLEEYLKGEGYSKLSS